jgi:arylsulfatase A-like enzyme
MNRRDFIRNSLAGIGIFAAGCGGNKIFSAAKSTKSAPNILIINIDDMGYGDMSCHGNPVLKTPNLDRLHAESVRFTQFHAAPMCTPTRGQLLTGIDALRNGSRWVGTEAVHLRTDLPVMPEIYKKAGYATGIFGKWHTGDNYPLRPQDRGFEEVVSFPQQEVGTVNDYWENDYFDDVYEHNGTRKQYKGFCTDVWFEQAINWIDKTSSAGKPFLCMIPTNVVHGPYFSPQIYRDMANRPNQPKDVQTFYGNMINLDMNVGRLLEFLDSKGIRNDTILIFMTDNGVTMGYGTYNAGMRGMKTQLWEGGHRVPLFISWPKAGLPKGKDINELAQAQDILPTLLDFCDVDFPTKTLDGISLAGQIRGEKEMPDRILVVQMQRRIPITKYDACVMWGPWRLLNAIDIDPHEKPDKREIYKKRRQNMEQVYLELYNVEEDPHQDNNVYDKYPEVVAKMKAAYEKWWRGVQPDINKMTHIIIGNDAENPSMLACTSWATTYFTQKSGILEGRKSNGYWNLIADQSGQYDFELCRWPKETNAALQDKVNIKYTDTFPYGPGMEGTALPVAKARIQVNDIDQTIDVNKGDKAAKFTCRLKKGPVRLKTWFYDKDGNELCGAYYVYVTRK